jgi:hypothetical protein
MELAIRSMLHARLFDAEVLYMYICSSFFVNKIFGENTIGSK